MFRDVSGVADRLTALTTASRIEARIVAPFGCCSDPSYDTIGDVTVEDDRRLKLASPW